LFENRALRPSALGHTQGAFHPEARFTFQKTGVRVLRRHAVTESSKALRPRVGCPWAEGRQIESGQGRPHAACPWFQCSFPAIGCGSIWELRHCGAAISCDIHDLMHSVADLPPNNRNNRLRAYIPAKTLRWHSGWDQKFTRRCLRCTDFRPTPGSPWERGGKISVVKKIRGLAARHDGPAR
jgi:hypothetical protein